MPIEAQSADGVVHQFPDGTSDAVIDATMREYTQSGSPQVRSVKQLSGLQRYVVGGVSEAAKGVAEIAGLPGIAEQTGRAGLNYLGYDVSPTPFLPTTSRILEATGRAGMT